MDFAFDPSPTRFDKEIRKMFSIRKDTTVIQKAGVNTVNDLINNLNNDVKTPLTNILLGSHGNESAQMRVEFVDGFGFTSYEALEFAINGLRRQCQVAKEIIDPRPQDASKKPIPPFFIIRGCRIGLSVPFVQKIKEVINGLSQTPIGVSAPKFFYELYNGVPEGIYEFFLEDFHVYTKTAIKTKADLVSQLHNKYKDIYNNVITDDLLNIWVPSNITKTILPLLSIKLNPPPVARLLSVKIGRYKFEETSILTWKVDDSVADTSLPKKEADVVPFLKKQMKDLAAHPAPDDDFGPTLQDTHPLPFFKRNGYNSIDEMVDGLRWIPSHKNRWFEGKRFEYTVSPPVIKAAWATRLNSKSKLVLDEDKNEAIFNFYADPAKGATSSSMFSDTDARFFTVV
jgi:hypothetical protein